MAFNSLFYFRSGYIGLGDCSAGLGNWPRWVRAPAGARNRNRKYEESLLKERFHKRGYTINEITKYRLNIQLKPIEVKASKKTKRGGGGRSLLII